MERVKLKAEDLYVYATDHNLHHEGGHKTHLYDWDKGKTLCGTPYPGTCIMSSSGSLTTFADVLDNNPVETIKQEFCRTCLKRALKIIERE